jgi:hypothetical protein
MKPCHSAANVASKKRYIILQQRKTINASVGACVKIIQGSTLKAILL